jgi:hypothetical protein
VRCGSLFNLEKQRTGRLHDPGDGGIGGCRRYCHQAVFSHGDGIAPAHQNGCAIGSGPELAGGAQRCSDGKGAPILGALPPSEFAARQIGDRPPVGRKVAADRVRTGFTDASEQQEGE